MNRNVLSAVCMLGLVVILPNCAKHQLQPLLYPENQVLKTNVSAGIHNLTEGEFRYHFQSAPKLKSYIPVQLYINNMSSKTYNVDYRNISAPLSIRCTVEKSLLHDGAFFFVNPHSFAGQELVRENGKIRSELHDLGFCSGDRYTISPNSTSNRVLFIDAAQYPTDLNVTLVNAASPSETIEYSFPLPKIEKPTKKK